MSVTNKKTESDSNQQDHSENNGDEMTHISKRSKHDNAADNKDSDLIEPKNEYDEDDDEDGNVEDLTMDELEDLEAGPSNAGEGSSQGESQTVSPYSYIVNSPTQLLNRLSLANGRQKPGITGRWTTERRTR
jgi:hypothetical protein